MAATSGAVIPPSKAAYFSTKGGKFARRILPNLPPRAIAIGDYNEPYEDQFLLWLRNEFPEKCKEIQINHDPRSEQVLEYFDDIDIYAYGRGYLNSVLHRIARGNITRIDQIARDSAARITEFDKFAQNFKTQNEIRFWGVRLHSTPQEVFDSAVLKSKSEEWLKDAVQHICSLQNKLLPKATHSQEQNRGNFHSDPERQIQEQVSEEAAFRLQYSTSRTVVSQPIEWNSIAQRNKRVPTHYGSEGVPTHHEPESAGRVALEDRLAFPPPPRARPRRNPTLTAFSNDARVLERQEAQENISSAQHVPSTNLPPIRESSTPLPSHPPFASQGPPNGNTNQVNMYSHSLGPFGGEQAPTMPTVNANIHDAGYPMQQDWNYQLPFPGQLQFPAQLPFPAQAVVGAQYPQPATSMPMNGHPQIYGPPQGYNHPPMPFPPDHDPQSRPRHAQNHQMSRGTANTGNDRRTSYGSRTELMGQENTGKDGRRSIASHGGPPTAYGRHRNGSASSEHQNRSLLLDKLWVGNLRATDEVSTLVPIFGPYNPHIIERLKLKGSSNWYTYVSFNNKESAAAALQYLGNKPLPELDGRRIKLSYAHVDNNRAGQSEYIGYGYLPPAAVQQQQPPPKGQQNPNIMSAMPGAIATNNSFDGQAGPSQTNVAGTSLHNVVPGLDARGSNRGNFAEGDQNRRPQLNITTDFPSRGRRARSQELLPVNQDSSRILGIGATSQTQGNRASSGGLLPDKRDQSQILGTGDPSPSTLPNLDPQLHDQGAASVNSQIDKQVTAPNVLAPAQNAAGNAVDSTTTEPTVKNPPPEDGLAIGKPDKEATVGQYRDTGAAQPKDQGTSIMPHQPLPMGDQAAIVGLPGEPAQAIPEDPKSGPSQPQPQAGAPGRSNPGNKKKTKAKTQPPPEAKRQEPNKLQVKTSAELDASIWNETVTGATDDRQGQDEIPTSSEGNQSGTASNQAPKNKGKGREQDLQTEGANTAKPTDAKPVLPHDSTEQTTEVPKAGVTPAEDPMSQKLDRGDSSSSHEAVETPALPHDSTQPTTYAASEVSGSDAKPLQDPLIADAAQALVDMKEIAEAQEGRTSKDKSIEVVRQDTMGQERDKAGTPKASQPLQPSKQSPKKAVLKPAVPDIFKIQQQYQKEKRLQEAQQELEKNEPVTDSHVLRQAKGNEIKLASPAKSLGTASSVTVGDQQQQFDETSKLEDNDEPAFMKQPGTPSVTASSEYAVHTSDAAGHVPVEKPQSDSGAPPAVKASEVPKISGEAVNAMNTVGPITTRKKKQKNCRNVSPKPPTPFPKPGPAPSVGTTPLTEAASKDPTVGTSLSSQTAPEVTSGPEMHQTKGHDIEAVEQHQTVAQDDKIDGFPENGDSSPWNNPIKSTEEHPGSELGSEPEETQLELVSGQGAPTASVKKKNKSKKSKKKKGKQPQETTASDVAADDTKSTQRVLPDPERPFEMDEGGESLAKPKKFPAPEPFGVDNKALSDQQAKSKIMESHREQINPNAPSFESLREEYYDQKTAMYNSLMPYTLDPCDEDDGQGKAREKSETAQTYPPQSPRSHQAEMLKEMKKAGYIIEEDANIFGNNKPSQAEGGKTIATMSEPQMTSLRKLLHVGKTAVSKEYGSQKRAAILRQLPANVVEGYIEGSLAWKSPAYKKLEDDVKTKLKQLAALDEEEAKYKATLKANEDDASKLPPPNQGSSQVRKAWLPGYERLASNFRDDLAEQLHLDGDALENFNDEAAQVKKRVEDQFELKGTFAGFARDDLGRLSKRKLYQDVSKPAIDELQRQLKLKALEARFGSKMQKENQKPRDASHSLEPIPALLPKAPTPRARITHGDGTEEVVPISGGFQDESIHLGKAVPSSEHVREQSSDAGETTPTSEDLQKAYSSRKGKGKSQPSKASASKAVDDWAPRKLPPPPVKPTEITWQWPGEPTPNVIVDNVLHVRKSAQSNVYEACFYAEPDDDLVVNTKEQCIEAIMRDNNPVWYRKDIPDPQAVDPHPTSVKVHDIKMLQETGPDEEIVWDKITEGKEQLFVAPRKQLKKGKESVGPTGEGSVQRPFIDRRTMPLETYEPEEERGKTTGRRLGDGGWMVPRGERAWGGGGNDAAKLAERELWRPGDE